MESRTVVSPLMIQAIATFFLPDAADRLTTLATSPTSKAHDKLRNALADVVSFRPSLIVPASSDRDVANLIDVAARSGSGSLLFELLSENRMLDGQRLPATEIKRIVVESLFGTFAVLQNGLFAVYRAERPNSTVVLRRS